MSFVGALGAVGAAALGTVAYLKTPRRITTLGDNPIYHGTTKERGPQAKEGEQVKVNGYLFFTQDRRLAEEYARDTVPSAFRLRDDVGRGTPVVYQFSLVNPDKTVYKRGLISGAPYLTGDTLLKVERIMETRKMSNQERIVREALSPIGQSESGGFY
jgi:hypothetical protein